MYGRFGRTLYGRLYHKKSQNPKGKLFVITPHFLRTVSSSTDGDLFLLMSTKTWRCDA